MSRRYHIGRGTLPNDLTLPVSRQDLTLMHNGLTLNIPLGLNILRRR